MQSEIFFWRDVACGILVGCLPDPHLARGVMRQVRSKTACRDRVIIRGIALSFAEGRDAAATALGHIGEFGAATVERRNQRLSRNRNRHLMRRPIAEVDYLFGVVKRVARIAVMSGVAADRCVTAANTGRQRADTDSCAASESAVAGSAQLAVPGCGWKPDLNLDFGIARWPGSRRDTAERREIVKTRTSAFAASTT